MSNDSRTIPQRRWWVPATPNMTVPSALTTLPGQPPRLGSNRPMLNRRTSPTSGRHPRSVLIWFYVFGYALWAQQPAHQWFMIEELQSDHLVYGAYGRTQTVSIDISDLIVPKENIGPSDPLNTNYATPQDFKYLLLQRGMAELRDPEKASKLYRDAQEQAKLERKGLWLARLGPPTPENPLLAVLVQSYRLASGNLWTTITLLSTLGFTSYIASWILERRKQRNPRLLFLGEGAAGKSAVCFRLLRPDATPDDILNLTHTQTKQTVKSLRYIQFGPLQIYPTYVDVPGTEYGVILDEFENVYHVIGHTSG